MMLIFGDKNAVISLLKLLCTKGPSVMRGHCP